MCLSNGNGKGNGHKPKPKNVLGGELKCCCLQSPTIRFTAWARAFGRATRTNSTKFREPSKPVASGSTANYNYPAHAPFGGSKKSGFGRENHKMMLDHYRDNKDMLISYDKKAMGFF